MVDVLISCHGCDGGREPHQDPSTPFIDFYFTPPTIRQKHSKSLNSYKLFKDLWHPIPIKFDIEGGTFYAIGEHSEYFVKKIPL